MHPEVIDVLGHFPCDIPHEEHEKAQDDYKENSEHENTFASYGCQKQLDYSWEVLVDGSKGVYDDPGVDGNAEKVDEVELLLPAQDALGFVDGPPLGVEQFGADVIPIDDNIGEGDQDNQG